MLQPAQKNPDIDTVYVTGGGGYVGSILIPKLLGLGYNVRVLDIFYFGQAPLAHVADHPNLTIIPGDLRDAKLISETVPGSDAVIHLACISNDPSFDLNPALGKSINYDCFRPLVKTAKAGGTKRFIYASSSSVYGIKEEEQVTEDLPREPLTDYSKYKAMCEDDLEAERTPGFTCLTIRPATVCGYGHRLRLDLTVNILTNLAYHNHCITVFGGEQMRPNLHIEDMTDFYLHALEWPDKAIDGKVYNVGYQNYKVKDIATMVKDIVGDHVEIVTTPSDDHRSYRVSSDKIKHELGFEPKHTVEDAIRDLVAAFDAGKVPDSLSNPYYFNIKRMQELGVG